MEALILVAELGGPTMFARIGVMRALNRGHVREFNPDRKDHHWGPPEAGEGSMTRAVNAQPDRRPMRAHLENSDFGEAETELYLRPG
jgi:hypothetical protein